jgi:hypothetical protein
MPAGSTCQDISQAEAENGLSRILIGIHFRNAVEEGIKHGRRLAHHTFVLFLRPLH